MMSDLINHHTIYSFAMIAFSTGQYHQPVIVWCVTILLLCCVSPLCHCVVCHHHVMCFVCHYPVIVLYIIIMSLCCVSSSSIFFMCHHPVIIGYVTVLLFSCHGPTLWTISVISDTFSFGILYCWGSAVALEYVWAFVCVRGACVRACGHACLRAQTFAYA